MPILETIRHLRNRLLANPKFRSKSQKIPFIHSLANRRANDLFALCSGFVHSQVLLAFVRTGLPDALSSGAKSVPQLASHARIPAARMQVLLRAATALELCAPLGSERYALGDLGAVLVSNDGLVAMILHHDALYEDLADPLHLLSGTGPPGQLQKYWAYADPDRTTLEDVDVDAYTRVMGASQQAVAEQALSAIDLGDRRHLLDLGGGDASFAIAAASKWPHLRVTVADLPAVVAAARTHVAERQLDDRIDTLAIDFHSTPLPVGHDALSVVRILHDHDDAEVAGLLRAAQASLPNNGLLIVAEPIAEATRAGRLLEAYFSFYLLAMGQGRLRRFSELKTLLEAAKFGSIQRHKTSMPLIASVVSALQQD